MCYNSSSLKNNYKPESPQGAFTKEDITMTILTDLTLVCASYAFLMGTALGALISSYFPWH